MDNQHERKALMSPCKTSSQITLSQEKKDNAKQIAVFVRQCFDMQDTYGLTGDQLENRMRGIIEDCLEFDFSIIQKSFLKWRRKSPKIPTPFDIRELCLEGLKDSNRARKTLTDFEGDFVAYRKYLKAQQKTT